MIELKDLVSPTKRPLITTICGDGGIGKTSLASLWPAPVMIRTEDGSRSIEDRQDVAMFPVAKTSRDVFEAIQSLMSEKHAFKTVIIDSITQLNAIIEAETIAADGKAKAINQALGGYGAGYAAASAVHRDIRESCQYLADEKGMHVVFIAHADIETMDLPDQPQYTRYTMRINKKSISHYTDNVDLVAFIKLQVFTTGDGEKKKRPPVTSGLSRATRRRRTFQKTGLASRLTLFLQKGKTPLQNIFK